MKVLKRYDKCGGKKYQFSAIASILFGMIFIFLGIILSMTLVSIGLLIISLIGVLLILKGIIDWFRAKPLLKGRFW